MPFTPPSKHKQFRDDSSDLSDSSVSGDFSSAQDDLDFRRRRHVPGHRPPMSRKREESETDSTSNDELELVKKRSVNWDGVLLYGSTVASLAIGIGLIMVPTVWVALYIGWLAIIAASCLSTAVILRAVIGDLPPLWETEYDYVKKEKSLLQDHEKSPAKSLPHSNRRGQFHAPHLDQRNEHKPRRSERTRN